jgi:hypothetical protein
VDANQWEEANGNFFHFFKVIPFLVGIIGIRFFYHETRYKLIHKLILSLGLILIPTVPFTLTLIDAHCTTHPPFFNYPLKFRKVRTNICKSPTKWGSVFKAKWGPISVKVPQSEDQSSKQSEDQYL